MTMLSLEEALSMADALNCHDDGNVATILTMAVTLHFNAAPYGPLARCQCCVRDLKTIASHGANDNVRKIAAALLHHGGCA